MEKPKVSVIIPVYNAEKHLRKCLDSVCRQTLDNIEIICVDDGSTDNSLNILQEYAQNDIRVHIYSQKNSFAGVARNCGMSNATGEFYAFLDADDYFNLESLEKLYTLATKNNLDMIKTYSYLVDEETREIIADPYYLFQKANSTDLNRVLSNEKDIQLLHSLPDSPWSGFYRARFLKTHKIHFNTLRCANDHSFFVNCICHAKRIMLTDIVLTYYRVNQHNSLISIRSKYFECQIESYKISKDLILSSLISLEDKKSLLKSELSSLFRWYHHIECDTISLPKNKKLMQSFISSYDISYVGLNYLKSFEFSQDFWNFYFTENQDKPEITIVIPAYNDDQYIGKCLQSAINQTMQNIEIIVVNDGSSDDTLSVVQNFAIRDKRIKIINKIHNQGAFAARRDGILYSKGNFVIFSDADDILEPYACQSAIKLITSHKSDILQFSVGVINHTGNPTATKWLKNILSPDNRKLKGKEILQELFVTRNITTSLFGKVYLGILIRSAALHMPLINSSIGEDILQQFFISFYAENYDTVMTEPLYWYNYGIGVSNIENVSLEKFIKYCHMIYLPQYAKNFMAKVNEDKNIVDIINCISLRLCEDCCRIYRNRIRKEKSLKALFLLIAYWGNEPIFKAAFKSVVSINVSEKNVSKEINQLCFLFNFVDKNEAAYLLDVDKIKSQFTYVNMINDQVFDLLPESPKVSVIIPVYNVEKYIVECISSVQSQTLNNIEIICVNDGSTDNSLVFLRDLARDDKRIKIINTLNGGRSSARNIGVEKARGKYIYFLDGDDFIIKDTLLTLYEECEKNELDIVYFDADSFCEKNDLKDTNIKNKLKFYDKYYHRTNDYSSIRSGEQLFIDLHTNDEYRASPCLQFIRSSFYHINNLNFYEKIIHEDNLFTLRGMLLAGRVKHLSKAFYRRRVHSNSTMTKPESIINLEGYFTVYLETLRFLEKHVFKLNTTKAVVIEITDIYISNIKRIYNKINVKEKMSFVNNLSPIEQIIFYQLLGTETHLLNERNKYDLIRMQAMHDKIMCDFNAMQNSISFRIGRKITWFPRKVRGGIRCLKEHGLTYTAKRCIEHMGINMKTGDFRK